MAGRHDLDRFLPLVRELGKRRKRDGAFVWGILEDTEIPNHFLEYFMVESWLEHLRQHERVTNADRMLQERIRGTLATGGAPEIMHYVAPGSEESTS